ncbi:MAG: hypothetical protein IT385_01880 [Deltaproteobacteria bacterium]|nr:hypothetical protein [Deltaproteobacteria bacterium]
MAVEGASSEPVTEPAHGALARPRGLGLVERALIALAVVALAGFFPWFPPLQSPNELTRVYLASALVEDGAVSIEGPIQRWGPIFDVSVRDGRPYSDKAPGVAFLAAPVIAAYDALADEPTLDGRVRLTRLVCATIPTVLLLFWMFGFLAEHLPDRGLRLALVAAYTFGTVATAYANLAFGHQLSAVTLFGLFLLIRRLSDARGAPLPTRRRLVAIGLVTGFAVWVEYQNVLLLLPLAGFFVWRTRRALPRSLAWAALGAAGPVLVLAAYHQAAFGAPWLTGYSFIASSFKEVHAQGLLGVALPKASHAFLSFLSPAKGLFFFAPWLALALLGLPLAWRRGGEGRVLVVVVVLYALFVTSLVYPVGGWTVSQRHLTPMVPFLVLPVGLAVKRLGTPLRVAFAGLAVAAIAICGVSAIVWPHYQEHLHNPFFQLGWPLFRDGWVPPSIFSTLGVDGWTAALLVLSLGASAALLGSVASIGAGLRGRAWLRAGAVIAAIALASLYLELASLPGRSQDVVRDRQWVESIYPKED